MGVYTYQPESVGGPPAAPQSGARIGTPFSADRRRTDVSATRGTCSGMLAIGAILALGVRDAVPCVTLTMNGG